MIKLNKTRANVKASSRKRRNEISPRRLRFEGLEERELLYSAGTYIELRDAIYDANGHANSRRIKETHKGVRTLYGWMGNMLSSLSCQVESWFLLSEGDC